MSTTGPVSLEDSTWDRAAMILSVGRERVRVREEGGKGEL
jgi:hypothetical protein